jgi:hypothetical protein
VLPPKVFKESVQTPLSLLLLLETICVCIYTMRISRPGSFFGSIRNSRRQTACGALRKECIHVKNRNRQTRYVGLAGDVARVCSS